MAKFKVLKECTVEGVAQAVGAVLESDNPDFEATLVAEGYLELVVEEKTAEESNNSAVGEKAEASTDGTEAGTGDAAQTEEKTGETA